MCFLFFIYGCNDGDEDCDRIILFIYGSMSAIYHCTRWTSELQFDCTEYKRKMVIKLKNGLTLYIKYHTIMNNACFRDVYKQDVVLRSLLFQQFEKFAG